MTIKVPMILEKHPDRPQSGLKAIGYWSQGDGDASTLLPSPKHHVDASWDPLERETVSFYLRGGLSNIRVFAKWMGYSWCRFDCDTSDYNMYSACLTDKVYAWPEGFVHYIERHDVRPPQEFVDHVLTRVHRVRPDFLGDLRSGLDDIVKDWVDKTLGSKDK